MAMRMSPPASAGPFAGEPSDIYDHAGQIMDDPDQWMERAHPLLGGLSPEKVIQDGGEEGEKLVRDLLRSIDHGMFS